MMRAMSKKYCVVDKRYILLKPYQVHIKLLKTKHNKTNRMVDRDMTKNKQLRNGTEGTSQDYYAIP